MGLALALIQTIPGCCSSSRVIGMTRVDMRPFVMDIDNCHRPTLFECTLVNAKEVECGSICLEMNLVFTQDHAGAQYFEEEEKGDQKDQEEPPAETKA